MSSFPVAHRVPPPNTREETRASTGSVVRSRRTGAAIESLAVLPFVNASGDPEAEYFCDGITENLINRLAQLPKLRVMARSTVFRYKKQDTDLQDIGRTLNVRAVLSGRIVQRGSRLILGVELVDVIEGWRLWGQQYDRSLADIFSIEEEIAKQISDNLRLRLSGQDKRRLARRSTRNVEAYQAYLRGRYGWNKRTEAGFKQATKCFEEAIEHDPTYALAYAGLADCYALLGIAEYGGLPPCEVMPRAKAAAMKALEIDEQLAEAHTSLAHVMAFYDWDWANAEREFKRAIQLNPRYAFAYHWYALFLAAMERMDEAEQAEHRALQLEPLSLVINKNVGTIYYYARQYDRAFMQYKKTLELEPDFARTHFFLGLAYQVTANFEQAVAAFQKALPLSGGSNVVLGALGLALASATRRGEAEDVLKELARKAQQQYVPSFSVAIIYLGLGQVDTAFEWLEKAYQERSSWLVSLKVEPMFDTLRADPRFVDLVKRVGLPA